MQRLVRVAAIAITVAAGLVPLAAASPAGASTGVIATQPCGGSSWWGGSTDVCNGRVLYRDYVYDDEGADTGDIGYNGTQNAYGTLAHPAGDKRYPAGDVSSADLVSLQLWRDHGTVQVLAQLNALYHPKSTVLAIAVDTDGRQTTGGGTWGALGVRSAGWDKLYTFGTGDTKTNTIRGSFPLPAAAHWRVQAVTAQAATHTVMNVAFRGVNEHASYNLDYSNPSPYPPSGRGAWFEDDQAAALAKGDISRFGYTVATADLQPGVHRLQKVGPGLHSRVYTSKYSLPQAEAFSYSGVNGRGTGGSASAFAQVFNTLGKYQPYGVYVPHTGAPYGLQMEWHGSNQGQVAQINQPGMQSEFGEQLGRLLVTPEARGPNGYGSDISERDLLDVMSDITATLPVDRNRVFSSGYSQGGYITFRMAMLFPQVFAGFAAWVGFTGDDLNGTGAPDGVGVTAGAVGNMINYIGNLRHVPGSMIYGAEDELVPVTSSHAMQQAFAATDDVYQWYLHATAEHLTFAALDDWRKEAAYSAGQRRVTAPARVTFRTDPFLDAPAYGIRHDRAYWVSVIRGQNLGWIDTDLTSHGCGGSNPQFTTGNGAGPAPVPWVSIYRAVSGSTAAPATPMLEGTLHNLRSATIDTRATCLGGRFAYSIQSDVPGLLTLSDGRQIPLHDGLNTGTV